MIVDYEKLNKIITKPRVTFSESNAVVTGPYGTIEALNKTLNSTPKPKADEGYFKVYVEMYIGDNVYKTRYEIANRGDGYFTLLDQLQTEIKGNLEWVENDKRLPNCMRHRSGRRPPTPTEVNTIHSMAKLLDIK